MARTCGRRNSLIIDGSGSLVAFRGSLGSADVDVNDALGGLEAANCAEESNGLAVEVAP